jgi:hypothetical protein
MLLEVRLTCQYRPSSPEPVLTAEDTRRTEKRWGSAINDLTPVPDVLSF